ncbi:hypothetical protein Tco_1115863 [Tanacetum coccineum]
MKLNLKKCTFGAEEDVFLGYVVNMKGIEACPEKTEAVIKLQSLRTLKEVQSLNGKLASLNRGGKGILRYEATHRGIAYVNHAKTKKGTNNVSLRSQRSGQRSPTSRKELATNADLLRQSRLASSKNKLHLNGKTGVSYSARLKKVEKTKNNYQRPSPGRLHHERPDEDGPPIGSVVNIARWYLDGRPPLSDKSVLVAIYRFLGGDP